MVANRNPPTFANTTSISGRDYADRIAEEIAALYAGRLNQVGTIGGSQNAITGVCTPPLISAYQLGETFRFAPAADNTATVTLNIDGRGAKALVNEDGADLVAGDLVAGRPVICWYHSASDRFRLGAPSLRSLIAALQAEISSESLWVILGDTSVSSPVNTIDHMFDADAYTEIKSKILGASCSAGSASFRYGLRDAANWVMMQEVGGSAIGANQRATIDIQSTIDFKTSVAREYYALLTGSIAGTAFAPTSAAAQTSSIADRIRYTFSVGNIDEGRFITYGLKKS